MSDRLNIAVADHLCDRCNKTAKTIGTVTIGKTLKCWCDECICLARSQGTPIQINDLSCERCGTRTVQGYHVFWTNHNQRWCEGCVQGILALEKDGDE